MDDFERRLASRLASYEQSAPGPDVPASRPVVRQRRSLLLAPIAAVVVIGVVFGLVGSGLLTGVRPNGSTKPTVAPSSSTAPAATTLHWTVHQFAAGALLHDITAIDGRLIVTGSTDQAAAWYSDDGGETWTDAQVDANARQQYPALGPIAGTGNRLISLGSAANGTSGADAGVHGAIWISEDGGVTWRPGPEETAPAIAGVITTGGPGFVAVGQRFKGTTAEVWTSPDGHAWTRAPHDPTFENATIAAIASSPQGLVAVGSRLTDPTQPDSQQPAVWFSTDGLHWAAASLTTNGGVLTDVTTDMSGFIASGYLTPALGPAIWRSTDGKAWQSQPMQREAGWVSGSIVSGPLGVVAIGQRVDLVATIPTSRAWLLPAGGARDQSAADLQFTIGDLAALPDRFVGTANCGPTADCSSDMIVIGKPAVTQEPSPSPRASGWTLASASASPKTIGLSRDDAVATARQFAGVGAATPTVDAESGPFSQFEPDPNQKNSPPSPDHLVWRVGFASSDTTERIVIIDYYTGALIQTSAAAR